MRGGLWPELLDTIAAAPVLRHLIIKHMPWDGDDRDVYDFPPTLRLPPICELAYICPYTIDESRRHPYKTRRPPHMLESEVHNLRVVLRACHSSLESLMLPGELILRFLDASHRWTSLRELRLQGYWPYPAEMSLYSVLRLLSNLRIVSLRFESADEDSSLGGMNPIVSSVLSTQSDMFLRKLQTFELAPLVPSDRILSLLPPGLQKLSVIAYPFDIDVNCWYATYRYTSKTCCASDLLNIFSGVHYPAVTRLELWYRADVSDADFLFRLPEVFPSLRYLEVHRFTPYAMDDQWNPARTFQAVLPHFKKLRLFALEPDDPHRRHKITPRGMVPRNAKYIRRLRSIAEEMVFLTPWLEEIWISVRFANEVRWERWDIVSAPGENICLRSPCAAETLEPKICAILEGPLEDAESDPEPVHVV
ncbi:hypothetical protein GGX14DRAFT_458569 [Mycena pura]|uniref:F-box domain-containing protein n=1 Tax=Mycena pura TaxID=153505 RepID=A0AAD6VC57_9AGAR|nr:hypothetical protein GGX14DRAFT_458569 [Mycena pura]